MTKPSKFEGWDLVDGKDKPQLGDIYMFCRYESIEFFDLGGWYKTGAADLISAKGRSWDGFAGIETTVLRRSTNWKPLPRRLAMSKIGSAKLPLP